MDGRRARLSGPGLVVVGAGAMAVAIQVWSILPPPLGAVEVGRAFGEEVVVGVRVNLD